MRNVGSPSARERASRSAPGVRAVSSSRRSSATLALASRLRRLPARTARGTTPKATNAAQPSARPAAAEERSTTAATSRRARLVPPVRSTRASVRLVCRVAQYQRRQRSQPSTAPMSRAIAACGPPSEAPKGSGRSSPAVPSRGGASPRAAIQSGANSTRSAYAAPTRRRSRREASRPLGKATRTCTNMATAPLTATKPSQDPNDEPTSPTAAPVSQTSPRAAMSRPSGFSSSRAQTTRPLATKHQPIANVSVAFSHGSAKSPSLTTRRKAATPATAPSGHRVRRALAPAALRRAAGRSTDGTLALASGVLTLSWSVRRGIGPAPPR